MQFAMQFQEEKSELDNPQGPLDLASQPQEEGNLEEAIRHYRAVVNIEENNLLAWQQLAQVYDRNQELAEAASCYQKVLEISPQDAKCYIKLAKVCQRQGQNLEAIAAYQKAIEIAPDQHFSVYRNLGNVLVQENQLEKSIVAYAEAIKLQPENPFNYCLLAKAQARLGDIDGTIASYQKAQELDPEKSLERRNGIANTLRQHQERYNHIWQTLNQSNIDELDATRYCYPTNNSWGGAREYFNQTSNYRVKGVWELDREDRLFLKENKISPEHLKSLNKDSLDKQESYLQHFNQNLPLEHQQSQLPPNDELHKFSKLTAFHKPMVTGYIYITCPFTGKVIRTNQSFLVDRVICAYRFVSDRIFYLVASNFLFEKALIYFPDLELVIKMRGNMYMEPALMINRLKAFFVANWQDVMICLPA